MKFNPITQDLYTDDGVFLKKLNCKFDVSWEHMELLSSNARKCANCKNPIYNTENCSDSDLVDLFHQSPDACLNIDLNQANVIILNNTSNCACPIFPVRLNRIIRIANILFCTIILCT